MAILDSVGHNLVGFKNARDIGGMLSSRGGATVRGSVIRSDTPTTSDSQGTAVLMQTLARVIDLRSVTEADALAHPMATNEGYRLRPLIDPRAEARRDPDSEATLGAVYSGSLGRNAATIAAIMVEIADAPDGTIWISCASGKDRTGMIIAMLLRLAGVSDEAIAEDYSRTEHSMREVFARELEEAPDDASRRDRAYLHGAKAENILQMLEHIDGVYGGVDLYLFTIGLNQSQVDRLRTRLLKPAKT
ncbi:tyrosine-protein phosphatase [Arthrobacter sp. CAN_A212]|uniref:tyrosine-protein phosphatase n=1 Tax=Arthrobacter sp. CAN_A212 TaxID=2787719 RepID=UPI002FEE9233